MLRLQEVWMRTLEKSIPDVAGIRQDLFLCSDHHGRPGAWVYFGDWAWSHLGKSKSNSTSFHRMPR